MPIPLGILAAAGFAPAAGGSYDLLETEIVGSTPLASVTFNNLGNYASDYQHLQIRAVSRSSTSSSQNDEMLLRLNGDSAGNYRWHRLTGNGSTVTSADSGSSPTYMRAGEVVRNGNTSGIFFGAVIDILDPYNTNKNTTVRTLGGGTGGGPNVGLWSGLWLNTASLTSITLAPEANNFVQYSRFSLYGLRK